MQQAQASGPRQQRLCFSWGMEKRLGQDTNGVCAIYRQAPMKLMGVRPWFGPQRGSTELVTAVLQSALGASVDVRTTEPHPVASAAPELFTLKPYAGNLRTATANYPPFFLLEGCGTT